MPRPTKRLIQGLQYLGLAVLTSTDLQAAEQQNQEDKTGTNPINFQRDIRVYNEFSWLNTAGDGSQNLTTLEFKTPFADGKWQWRGRTRYNAISADLNDDGSDELDDRDQGDTDMRFLTVPILDKERFQAWAFGMAVFLDTASEDSLGSGATALGPQVFFVQFLKNGLFAPALQYKRSIDEEEGRSEIEQYLVDFNYLRMGDDKNSWFFADPQFIIDREADSEYAIVDVEFGWMMSCWLDDMQGHSFYIRPSLGIGNSAWSMAQSSSATKLLVGNAPMHFH